MFRRKPRYLIDQHGELRHVHYRQGSFFPNFHRSLRPDKPNLTAVEINGKWVLVEVDGNEQKKTVELEQAVQRRQGLVMKSGLAAVFAFAAWNGPFGYNWIHPVETSLAATLGKAGMTGVPLHLIESLFLLLLGVVSLALAFLAGRFALSGLKCLALEILYRLRFPFMKGARAQLLPTVPRRPINLPWNAMFEDPMDAARQMAASGPSTHAAPLAAPLATPKQRRLKAS
jgi:hypothetical protein